MPSFMDVIGRKPARQPVSVANGRTETGTDRASGPEVPVSVLPFCSCKTVGKSAAPLKSSYKEVKSATEASGRDVQAEELAKTWGDRKRSSVAVAMALESVDLERSQKLRGCGCLTQFQHWIEHDKTTVAMHTWCNMPRLCQACAHARGIQLAKLASRRAMSLLAEDETLRPWLVTFTVKNGRDLADRLGHLIRSFSAGWKRRKNLEQGRRGWTEFAAPEGVIYSIEIKRGRNSGEWHAHMHCLFLVPEDVWAWERHGNGFRLERETHARLSREWFEITGDSMVVNAKPLRTAIDQGQGLAARPEYLMFELFEVFKYLTKPGETKPADTVHAWWTTQAKRLVRSYGNLVGIDLPKGLNEDPLDGPSWLAWYRWRNGSYQRDGNWKFQPSTGE